MALLLLAPPPAPCQELHHRITATISGFVFDSVAKRPLAAALVQLVSKDDPAKGRPAVTDSVGRYHFDHVESGTYLLGFYHPALDSIGLESPLTRVDVRSEGEIIVPIALPSPSTIVRRSCGKDAWRDSTGIFSGAVRSAKTGAGLRGANVVVQWKEYVITRGHIDPHVETIEAKTGEAGAFAICGVPTAATLLVRTSDDSASSGYIELEVPDNGLLRREIYVGQSRLDSAVAPSEPADTGAYTEARQVSRGKGRLAGVVKGSNGSAIEGARLALWGTGLEFRTNDAGRFTLQGAPSGTYSLEVRALGYLPVSRVVDIFEGDGSATEIAMDTPGAFLDTVRIAGRRDFLAAELEQFERLSKSGFGHYVDEARLARLNAVYTSDFFTMMPGVSVTTRAGIGHGLLLRSPDGGRCAPSVYVDAVLHGPDEDLDLIVSPKNVRSMMVFTRVASIPPQYNVEGKCGSVVFWTKARAGDRLRTRK